MTPRDRKRAQRERESRDVGSAIIHYDKLAVSVMLISMRRLAIEKQDDRSAVGQALEALVADLLSEYFSVTSDTPEVRQLLTLLRHRRSEQRG